MGANNKVQRDRERLMKRVAMVIVVVAVVGMTGIVKPGHPSTAGSSHIVKPGHLS